MDMAQITPVWQCAVCLSKSQELPITINDDQACSTCVQNLFERSIINEENFPPVWGSTVLNPMDFKHTLEADFLDTFECRQKEWTCPLAERVYCRNRTTLGDSNECGHFVGQSTKSDSLPALCHKCLSYTCLQCSETLGVIEVMLSSSVAQHRCKTRPAEHQRDEAFRGLVRGHDYQDCPNPKCRRRVELWGGCNHITCRCGIAFCYICGAKILDHDIPDHWRRDGCPRYGLPETASSSSPIPVAGDAGDHRQEDWIPPSAREACLLQRPTLHGSSSRPDLPWRAQRADRPVLSEPSSSPQAMVPRRAWGDRILFRRRNSDRSREATPGRELAG